MPSPWLGWFVGYTIYDRNNYFAQAADIGAVLAMPASSGSDIAADVEAADGIASAIASEKEAVDVED